MIEGSETPSADGPRTLALLRLLAELADTATDALEESRRLERANWEARSQISDAVTALRRALYVLEGGELP